MPELIAKQHIKDMDDWRNCIKRQICLSHSLFLPRDDLHSFFYQGQGALQREEIQERKGKRKPSRKQNQPPQTQTKDKETAEKVKNDLSSSLGIDALQAKKGQPTSSSIDKGNPQPPQPTSSMFPSAP